MSIHTIFFFFNDTATTEIYTLSLHDALPISPPRLARTPLPLMPCGSASMFSCRAVVWPSMRNARVGNQGPPPWCAFLIVRSDDAHSSEKENIPMKWITREHVKVDRVACPWLIKKFVDKDAEFLFVPTDQVMEVAEREGAIPYDVKAVELGHHGKECSFEAILKKYGLTSDPALVLLGKIVNGADTDNSLWHQPEGEGLEAIAEGFRHLGFKDDHEQNAAEWIVYDALYAYCQEMVRQDRPDGAFKAASSQETGKTNPWDRTGVQPAQ